jgi:hypothetical protein
MTGLVLLGLALFFLIVIMFIHRYFGQSITSPSTSHTGAGSVSAFTGEIAAGGNIVGGASGASGDACGGHGGGHGGDCGDGGGGGH